MKKLLTISMLALIPLMAQAQTAEKPKFMGINSMPITDEGASVILLNAIKSKDFGMLSRWEAEKGLKIANSENEACYINYTGSGNAITMYPSQKAFNKEIYSVMADQLSAGNYPIFTNCNDLTFIELLKHGMIFSANPTTLEMTTDKRPKREDNTESVQWILKSMDNLTPEQWPQLIPAIISPNQDYSVRTKAANKFVEFYNQVKKTPNQEQLLSAIAEYRKNPQTASRGTRVYFDIATNPAEYAYQKVFLNSVEYTQGLNKNPNLQKLFSKDFFAGKKKVTVEDIKKATSKSGERTHALRVLTAQEIMNSLSKTKDFDINRQDFSGNTMFHNLFTKGYSGTAQNNRVLANWLRAFWEEGANPLLLNKANQTPYMMFESSRNTSPSVNYAPLIESFTLQEYNY